MVAAGPHFQAAIVFPPSVVPTSAVVPVWIGVRETEFKVAVVAPPSAVSFPTTVITPLASTDPDLTYFVTVKAHAAGNTVEISA